jgi:hypothetical protein
MSKGQNKGSFMVILGGVMAVSIFTIIMMMLLGGAKQSAPNLVYDQSQYAGFDKTDEVVNITESMSNEFSNANASSTNAGDIITVTTTGGYNTLRFLRAIPGIYSSMLFGTSSILGVPAVIAQIIALIPIISILALFILLVFRVYVS